jgi:hypothetical protein
VHDFLQFLLFVAGWVVLQQFLFPKLGVPT